MSGISCLHRILEVSILSLDAIVGSLALQRQLARPAELPASHRLHRVRLSPLRTDTLPAHMLVTIAGHCRDSTVKGTLH